MYIKSVSIQNFRSIENQTITDIDNALILIGKNNSGKSSVITSIRAFFEKYQIEAKDFPPNQEEIQIKTTFEIEEEYFQNYIYDQTIGISKYPANAKDFDSIKAGTIYSNHKHSDYKQEVEKVTKQIEERNKQNKEEDKNQIDEKDFTREYPDIYGIWLKCLKKKCKLKNNLMTVTAKIKKNSPKVNYYDSDDEEIKLVTSLFPEVSYIHDERSFTEEETGKTNTLTHNLFTNKILNIHRNSAIKCNNCEKENCDECFCLIKEKMAIDLTIDDLEKLTQIQLKEISQGVSKTISEYFQDNYQKDYNIKITPQCNINKSATNIITKIYDPNIEKELSISNVGAGLRNIYYLSLLQAYNELYGNKFFNNRKTLYLLEEPEIYLHPSLQKEMCSTLYGISQSNQIFFTTHSPLLLKNFDSTQIRKLSLNNRFKSEISNTNISEVLNEIGYSTADVLQTEFVIICEGKDDKERLSLIIEKFYNLDTKNIFFLNAKGCTNIETYATLEFLDRTELKDNFAIIRDSDTEDTDKIEESLLNKYKENVEPKIFESVKNRILILKYSALECYFLNPDILYKLGIIGDNYEFDITLSDYINN
ncbi:MAG: AAA family ATPase [Methanosarcina sp.]